MYWARNSMWMPVARCRGPPPGTGARNRVSGSKTTVASTCMRDEKELTTKTSNVRRVDGVLISGLGARFAAASRGLLSVVLAAIFCRRGFPFSAISLRTIANARKRELQPKTRELRNTFGPPRLELVITGARLSSTPANTPTTPSTCDNLNRR
jgi:hypothetical protein